MLLNLDIWREIISYLVYPWDKTTLHSLAVTSRCLSNLALDTIWRRDATVEAIISLINSLTTPNEPFLEYIQEPKCYAGESGDEGSPIPSSEMIGNWVLNKPLPHSAQRRVLGYLARIRELTVCHDEPPSVDEEPIWPVLYACLSPHGPFLQHLQCLNIKYLINNHSEYLIPFLSPSLKDLEISSYLPLKARSIATILNLAKAHGCDLESFTYSGYPIHHIPEAIMLFKNLQVVQFPPHKLPSPRTPITIVQFLASLPSLRWFACHLGAFSPAITDEYRFRHTNLQMIETKSEPNALRELFRTCVFPSVTDVKILYNEVPSMEGIESSCPNIRRFNLRFDSHILQGLDEPVEFKHLSPLLSLPIQVFTLSGGFNSNLTSSDLRTFAESWPGLRSFRVYSRTKLDPLPSLAAFSNHPSLGELDLHLSFHHFLHDFPKVPIMMQTGAANHNKKSCLRVLQFDYRTGRDRDQALVSTSEKHALVEYMLHLFPRLEKFDLGFLDNLLHEEELEELQGILLELRKEREERPAELA